MRSNRNIPKVVFEYCVPIWPREKAFHYRLIRAADGYLRMEKKGITAKSFHTICWGGTETSHYEQAVFICRRKR